MRPNFTMWSDYGAPAQRQWMSTSKRSAGSSIGPKILLAAVVVVAGVIGISGIYPQVIDAEWMQDNGTHLPILSLPTSATTKPSSTAAALPLRGRHAVTAGRSRRRSVAAASLGGRCRAAANIAAANSAAAGADRGCGSDRSAGACRNSRCGGQSRGARNGIFARQGGRQANEGREEEGGAAPPQLCRGLRPVWRMGRLGWLVRLRRLSPVLNATKRVGARG
jgi:hypothetical protein